MSATYGTKNGMLLFFVFVTYVLQFHFIPDLFPQEEIA